MNANEKQVGGDHYKKRVGASGIGHWDVCAGMGIGYLESACTKYLMRWRDKNGRQDLEKAEHYLQKLIEMVDIGAIRKNKAVINERVLKHFYDEAQISYPESLVIDTVFRWKNSGHLKSALKTLQGFIESEEFGATSAYVKQD